MQQCSAKWISQRPQAEIWGTKCHTLMVTIQLSTPENYFLDVISTQNNPISVVLIFSGCSYRAVDQKSKFDSDTPI